MCQVLEDMCNQVAAETTLKNMRKVAYDMLEVGRIALEDIVKITGFSMDEIEKMKEEQGV